jgi:hypothetical protein
LKILVIKNIPYEKYRKIVYQAKWALSFGEGLDGYFLETIFSGGISFAVYNKQFFTEDFKSLTTVYADYSELKNRVCTDLKDLDSEYIFNHYQTMQHEVCSKYYNYNKYVENLKSFYKTLYFSP